MDKLVKLPWDSEFFGYLVGKIDVKNNCEESISDVLEEAKKARLTYIFSDVELSTNKLSLVDKRTALVKKIANMPSQDQVINLSFRIESYNSNKHKYSKLESLAIESGVFSRFYKDKNFKNNEFERMYKVWLRKSLDKTRAFETFIAIEKDNILGFITVNQRNEETAEIGLIAVDQNFRGRGIAKSLINVATKKVAEKGFTYLNVVTQMDNVPAMSLYKSLNFKQIEIKYIYHVWNYDTL